MVWEQQVMDLEIHSLLVLEEEEKHQQIYLYFKLQKNVLKVGLIAITL